MRDIDLTKPSHQLIYTSTLTTPLVEADVDTFILRNRARSITGLLLIHNSQVIQLLEGDRAVVNTLYNEITSDPRHINVTLLRYTFANKREFGGVPYRQFDITGADMLDITDLHNINDTTAMSLFRRMDAIDLSRIPQHQRRYRSVDYQPESDNNPPES